MKLLPSRPITDEYLSRVVAGALKNGAASRAKHTEQKTLARALKEAGAPDDQIDAAERAAELADRAAIRFKAEADAVATQRRELAAANQAKLERELTEKMAALLDQHTPNARAAARTAYQIQAHQMRMAEAGVPHLVAKVPPIPMNVFDGSFLNGANPRVSEDHPLLDAFENEVARFKAALK